MATIEWEHVNPKLVETLSQTDKATRRAPLLCPEKYYQDVLDHIALGSMDDGLDTVKCIERLNKIHKRALETLKGERQMSIGETTDYYAGFANKGERQMGIGETADYQRSSKIAAEVPAIKSTDDSRHDPGIGCMRPGPGGDCEHYIGLPGKSIGHPDKPADDTVDEYGKPNGWCWSCWKSHQIMKMGAKISASEALFGFCGWLTSRDESITMSGCHNAGDAADVVALFCKVNDLPEPRPGWDKNLVHPKEGKPVSALSELSHRAGILTQKFPMYQADESTALAHCRPTIAEMDSTPMIQIVLKILDGDLSYDKVAEARKILKASLRRDGEFR